MNSSTVTDSGKRRPKFQKPRYTDKRKFNHKRERPEYLGEGLSIKVLYRGDSEEEKTQALDKALSQLKKLLSKAGVPQNLKEKQYFISKSRKYYLKKKQIIYKHKTKMMKKTKRFRKKS